MDENNDKVLEEFVTLEIENTSIPCKKRLLIENSEYFRAMFSGNFLETHQNIVKIEGVDAKSLNTVLTLLWDHTYTVNEEDLLPLLHVSLMLQFDKIKDICEERILETLKPSNCLKIWQQLDQQSSPLDLKAKCMALEEFSLIWETHQIFDLNIDEICIYLGHTNLNTKNEFDVFQASMKWLYEHLKTCENSNSTDLILRLLHCLDFKQLSKENIQEMKTYPDIYDNKDREITNLLDCILYAKENTNLTSYLEKHKKLALKFLSESKSRRVLQSPCVVLDKGDHKLFRESKNKDDIGIVVFRDKYGRKRKYDTVLAKNDKNESGFFNHCYNMLGLLYDWQDQSFTEFFLIPENKFKGLTGFEILGYKEFMLLFGGEVTIGMGNWNNNLWMYDTFREKWERRGV